MAQTESKEVGIFPYVILPFGVLGVLTTFWIPTLGLLLGGVVALYGFLNLRGASGRARTLAIAAIVLGLLAPVAFVVIVVAGVGSPTSGDAVAPQ
jgi:hypothetical protein